MAVSLKYLHVLVSLSAFVCCASAVNDTILHTTGVSGNVNAVLLDNDASFAVCVYPTSGTYSFLNRILYYCIFIFSLFSRAHLWLVAGALAAALTYSGSAAVHACLLVWRGPNPFIENDSWVLYSILNSACLITVPLLNWSGTLRRLGAKAASIRDPKRTHTQGDVGTRTIVVYWSFLVLVGFICIWQQILFGAGDNFLEYPDMSQVMCASGTNASMLMSPNGTYHRRAIDTQFIQDNACSDPCNQIDIPSIFRQQNDLVLLDHRKALLWNVTLPGTKYQFAETLLTKEDQLFNLAYYTLPFILIQGFVAVLFGRRDPREIRDLIYITLFMERPLSHIPVLLRTQDILARILAAFNYLLAVAVVILCPPLFIVTLISSELQFWNQQPDAEAPYAVGQWSPWAVTCLVILAALIARFHDRVIRFICTTWRHSFSPHRPAPGANPTSEHSHASIASDSTKANPFAGKADVHPQPHTTHNTASSSLQASHPSDQEPDHDPEPASQSLWRQTQDLVHRAYRMFAHPLNQSDRGLFDELRNFLHWCRDPQAVSRLVVRHPVRPRDTRDVEEDGDEAAAAAADDEKGATGGGGGGGEEARPEYRDRFHSGFFRGASKERGHRRAEKWKDTLGL